MLLVCLSVYHNVTRIPIILFTCYKAKLILFKNYVIISVIYTILCLMEMLYCAIIRFGNVYNAFCWSKCCIYIIKLSRKWMKIDVWDNFEVHNSNLPLALQVSNTLMTLICQLFKDMLNGEFKLPFLFSSYFFRPI